MEASTLADALLDDLDDLSDVEETPEEKEASSNEDQAETEAATGGDSASDGMKLATTQESGAASSSKSKRFIDNESLQRHLDTIRRHMKEVASGSNKEISQASRKQLEAINHQLVVQSNKHLTSLADELAKVHTELASAYKPKFPELEELVPNAFQYKNAIRCIWNETDPTKVSDELNQILSSNQIITITVAASTTSGRPLTEDELQKLDQAATYMEELMEVQSELILFVESSMESLAPSICALIGARTAAQMLGMAGGLHELTKIPACNLQVLGQVKHTSTSRAGLSGASIRQHAGILTDCELVQKCPKQLHKKALKAVAAKLALAARFDFVNVDTGRPRSASAGLKFRQELNEKFEKLQEPDKAQVLKALPNPLLLGIEFCWQISERVCRWHAFSPYLWNDRLTSPSFCLLIAICRPDLSVKKRRGGKRMRRFKERFEETAMMKQANTRAFMNQQGEYGDDAMGITMGLLESADSGGAVRKGVAEKRKMRQANTKASRKRAMQMAQHAKNANANGLASSVVFSQTSSMELVNPDANKDRVREANRKWFSDNAGFQSALPKK